MAKKNLKHIKVMFGGKTVKVVVKTKIKIIVPNQKDPNNSSKIIKGTSFEVVIKKITSKRDLQSSYSVITFEFSGGNSLWFWDNLPAEGNYHTHGFRNLLSVTWTIISTPNVKKKDDAGVEYMCAQCKMHWNEGAIECSYCQTTRKVKK